MALIDQLFGQQPQTQDTGGLVQQILSQRFQPSIQDASQAMLQTATTGGKMVSPYEVMGQRIAPAMQVAGTMGQLNMSQAALQHMQDEHDMNMLMMMKTFGAMPAGMAGGMPQPSGQGMPQQLPWQQGSVSQPGMQPAMPQQASGMPSVGFPTDQTGGAAPAAMTQTAPQASDGMQPPPLNDNRQPWLTNMGQPIPATKDPIMMRDQQGNMSAGMMPGASDVISQTTQATKQGENVAEAKKNVVGIDTRLQNAINILNDQIDLAPLTFSGEAGKMNQEIDRSFANFFPNRESPSLAAQAKFQQNNANLFTQELPAVMAGLGQSRIDIPLVNAIKEASNVYQYAASGEKAGAAQNLKGLLFKAQQNIHKNAAGMGAGNTPIPTYTDPNPPQGMPQSAPAASQPAQQAEMSKTLGGKTYVKRNGKWFEQ